MRAQHIAWISPRPPKHCCRVFGFDALQLSNFKPLNTKWCWYHCNGSHVGFYALENSHYLFWALSPHHSFYTLCTCILQNGHQASTSSPQSGKTESRADDADSDSDVQEIPVAPPVIKEIFIPDTEDDNYEAVEMELDTEESCEYTCRTK